MSFGDHEVSEDFLRLYGSAFFPHWTLDAAKHRIVFLPGQVEDAARLSSHVFAGKILRRVVLIMIADDLQLQGKHPAPVFEALKVIFYCCVCFLRETVLRPLDGGNSALPVYLHIVPI